MGLKQLVSLIELLGADEGVDDHFVNEMLRGYVKLDEWSNVLV